MERRASPLKVSQKTTKTRRGGGGSKGGHQKHKSLKILGNNIAGLSGKSESLHNLIQTSNPGVVMLQETKLYKIGKFKADGFCVFESHRENKEGGGLMTLIHENLNPVQIPYENKSFEKMGKNILTVEADTGGYRTRFINIYGIQESCSVSERIEFFSMIECEIEKHIFSEAMLCIEIDGNAKFGSDIISGDPHKMTPNGEILYSLILRKGLILINSTEKCTGVITRIRNTTIRNEKKCY